MTDPIFDYTKGRIVAGGGIPDGDPAMPVCRACDTPEEG